MNKGLDGNHHVHGFESHPARPKLPPPPTKESKGFTTSHMTLGLVAIVGKRSAMPTKELASIFVHPGDLEQTVDDRNPVYVYL